MLQQKTLRLSPLIFWILSGCSPGTLTEPSPSQTTSQITYEVSTRYQDGLMTLLVSVNGAPSKPFILDTGAANTLVSEAYRQDMGAKPVDQQTLTGTGKAVVSVNVIQNLVIQVAGLQWVQPQMVVLPTEVSNRLSSVIGQPFQGILGGDLFRNYVVEVDYQQQRLRLFPPESFEYQGAGEILPLQIRNQKPYIQGTVTWPSQQARRGEFLLDLGSSAQLDLWGGREVANDAWLAQAHRRDLTGVGGDESIWVGRLQSFQFGRQVLSSPIASVSATPASSSALKDSNPIFRWIFGPPKLSGQIGNRILQHYTLIFDYSRQRVIFEPNDTSAPSFEQDMTGLRLVALGPNRKIIKVSQVYPHSPAEALGLKPGDRLLKIDDQSVDRLSLAEIRAQFKAKPGVTKNLTIARNASILRVQLTLKRLI